MNCDKPTIAVRRAGINPLSGTGYKPHTFIKYDELGSDDKFVKEYFRLKRLASRSTTTVVEYLEPTLPGVDLGVKLKSKYLTVPFDGHEVLLLGCNKCVLCNRTNKRNWATRCIHEAQLSNGGVFLTLTVSDDSLARTFPGGSLSYEPFQRFMKRLRKGTDKYQMIRTSVQPIRFFMCGEYGERYGRPHYHAALFGCDFPEKFVQRYNEDNQPLYDSPFLIELRNPGGVEEFGEVSNFAPISPYDLSYVAGYVEKKLYKDQGHYIAQGLKPEFANMSRRPGIGASWIDRYYGDCWKFLNDTLLEESCLVNGFKHQVPRFYFDRAKITGRLSSDECDIIMTHRRGRLSEVSSNPEALMASLKQGHARAVEERNKLRQVLRRF